MSAPNVVPSGPLSSHSPIPGCVGSKYAPSYGTGMLNGVCCACAAVATSSTAAPASRLERETGFMPLGRALRAAPPSGRERSPSGCGGSGARRTTRGLRELRALALERLRLRDEVHLVRIREHEVAVLDLVDHRLRD